MKIFKASSKRSLYKFVLLLGLIVCLGEAIQIYFSNIRYLLSFVGLTEKAVLQDVEIVMGDGWFVSAHSDAHAFATSALTRPKKPGMILTKVRGFKPGIEYELSIDRRLSIPSKDSQVIAYSKSYPWGIAYFIRKEIIEAPIEDFVVLPEFGLEIYAPNPAALEEIRSIRKIGKNL